MNGSKGASAPQHTTTPTSPWAQAFQAASQRDAGACTPTAMSSEDESQRLTYDALSDIDNREV